MPSIKAVCRLSIPQHCLIKSRNLSNTVLREFILRLRRRWRRHQGGENNRGDHPSSAERRRERPRREEDGFLAEGASEVQIDLEKGSHFVSKREKVVGMILNPAGIFRWFEGLEILTGSESFPPLEGSLSRQRGMGPWTIGGGIGNSRLFQ